MRVLILQERDTRARDLNFYRGLSFAVLAGAGTVFFGLMLMYGRLFEIDTTKVSQAGRETLEFLYYWIPVLGAVAQVVIEFSLLHLHSRIRTAAHRLQQIHRIFGVPPEVDTPWWDPIGTRRAHMEKSNWWFLLYQLPHFIPNMLIMGIWIGLVPKV